MRTRPFRECRRAVLIRLGALIGFGVLSVPVWAAPPQFMVVVAPSVSGGEPLRGRVIVFLGKADSHVEPRFGPNWFDPQPMLSVDAENAAADKTIKVGGPGTTTFPRKLDKLSEGEWVAQAVLARNPDAPNPGSGEDNAYSSPMPLAPDGRPTPLIIDKIVKPRPFPTTARFQEIVVPSMRLSQFYGRPMFSRASVLVPEGYDADSARRYPVLYIIPGFGGTDRSMGQAAFYDGPGLPPMLRVVLDPTAGTGHHVFADSANNGPRGEALIQELIPAIEKKYRALGTPAGRLLTGHSSGGWSSLWLQVTYPDFFGGVWSTSPDPVDFRDFQQIDLYAPGANMFTDPAGQPRPLARRGEMPVVFYRAFSDMERVLGHGGQLASFEAVFSPRDPNGHPRLLWNRETGAVDSATAHAWEKYDIRLVLERNWPTLGPKLAGKLHIYTGGLDTFYLDGAVRKLKESLAKLGSDAAVEIIPGTDHGSLLPAVRARVVQEMTVTLGKTEH